ncbi:YlbF family regulator [Paenibacillus sp. 2TAB19]|uniref:YlbF family regulator n=1 Tax=Paenibacillus sp. 2TAB19 TaxID=3233003 RepID=UPI003F96BE18
MNVYDKAYDLAKALKDSSEAEQLKTVKRAMEADPEASRIMEGFRERQMELQQKMMSGEEPTEAEMASITKLYEEIAGNPLIASVLEAERQLAVVFEDINRLLNDVLKAIAG